MKIFISFLSVVLFIVAIVWLASPREKTSASEKKLAGANPSSGILVQLDAEEREFNFGQISMAKGSVTHLFNLKNNSTEPVSISKLYTSCMCTNASISTPSSGKKGPFGMPGHGFIPSADSVLNPGETAEVAVVFDPAAHGPSGVGRIERSVYLESTAGRLAELRISANVAP